MSGRLPDGHFHRSRPVFVVHTGESVLHLLLSYERLDDAQSSESLLDDAESVAPFRLCVERLFLQLLSYPSDAERHEGNDQQGEECEFPADGDESDEVNEDEDRVFDHHVERAGDG